ncbi:hypothetical protein ZEAMMB73_Zm00001d027980 [Zea mays]|uniref:EF-hand domain-containing protein n=1 Tax=Zea mays TaxID=4577 RepID=A0A1D6JR42_MAIZE|nr:hypothetical protein ZEAMMB73_Zm00001d027980 [Zea mays]ONL94424.1 hypothetical protein ZEAMMB73_Zm00001d027980 [Zea mays]
MAAAVYALSIASAVIADWGRRKRFGLDITLRWVEEEEESEGGRRGCLAEPRGEGERHLQVHNLGETATMSVPHGRQQDLELAIDDFDEELIDPELRFSFQRNSKVCGVDLTDKVVDIIFHVFDANCDGNLSSEEFLRKRLFSMMSDLPSVLEAFADRKHGRDRSRVDSSGKSRHSSKRGKDGHAKSYRAAPPAAKEYDEDEEEHTETFCGSCDGLYIGSN